MRYQAKNKKLKGTVVNSFISLYKKWNFNILYVIGIIYVIPILIANVYYIDDMGRVLDSHDWKTDGRLLSSVITKILSGNWKIESIFPFNVFICVFFIISSGIIISEKFFKEHREIGYILPIFILCSPFMLENILYRYDSVPMILSIYLSVLPFVFKNSTSFSISSVICLVSSLLLYQTSPFIYIEICILSFIYSCNKHLSIYKKSIYNLILSLCFFVISCSIYKAIIWYMDVNIQERGSICVFNKHYIIDLISRIGRYNEIFHQLLNSGYMLPILSIILVSMIGIIFSYKKFSLTLSYFILIPMSIIMIGMPNLIISTPWYSARTMVCFPFFFIILLYFFRYIPKKFQLLAPGTLGLFILSSFSLSAVLGQTLYNNKRYIDFLSYQINDKIIKTNPVNASYVYIYGQMPVPPRNQTFYNNYPIMTLLAPMYMSGEWWWGMVSLSEFSEIHPMATTQIGDITKYTPIEKNSLFSMEKLGDKYIINFK